MIFHGGRAAFMGKRVIINGIPMIEVPAHYRRYFINETGGITFEYSLKPFKNGKAKKKSYPR